MPLYPDWINAENTIIWLVTFQIQISNSNFQIRNKFLCLICRFLLQNVFLKLINIFAFFVFFVFILVDAFSGSIKTEITTNLFTLAESNFQREKTFVHSLELWRNFICGNEMGSPVRAVSLHLARSGSQSEHRIGRILSARGARHVINIFNSYSSRTRRIWADIYNQRGRRPSWLLSAHIRQVWEE